MPEIWKKNSHTRSLNSNAVFEDISFHKNSIVCELLSWNIKKNKNKKPSMWGNETGKNLWMIALIWLLRYSQTISFFFASADFVGNIGTWFQKQNEIFFIFFSFYSIHDVHICLQNIINVLHTRNEIIIVWKFVKKNNNGRERKIRSEGKWHFG
jgi:hypothetical protein